jgi:hypothetical protein
MSVMHLSDPANFGEHGVVGFLGECPADCFWCGKPLADPVVFWHALGGGTLWLHHRCAHRLALNLLYDAQRAEAVARGKRLDAGVAHAPPVAAYRERRPA